MGPLSHCLKFLLSCLLLVDHSVIWFYLTLGVFSPILTSNLVCSNLDVNIKKIGSVMRPCMYRQSHCPVIPNSIANIGVGFGTCLWLPGL